jgi:two-component system sensor histidine kinase CpxA
MSGLRRFPLLARVLGWLVLHLVLLGLAFFLFVRWQFGLGLDSLLSGSAGERLTAFGESARSRMEGKAPREWNGAIAPLARERQVTAAVFDPLNADAFPRPVPANVIARARSVMPPPRPLPAPRQPGSPGLRLHDGPPPRANPAGQPRPGGPAGIQPPPFGSGKSRPVFLMRGQDGGYWAGVMLRPQPEQTMPNRAVLLLVHAERLDGSGMFFDLKPWLWGGAGVLLLSLAFWTPFVWGISRYLRRLTVAADQIACGRFQVALPPRGNDELGQLGRAIESMAARLDHLVTGQKRFLGDAAHELCAPLARIRTAVGILENQPDTAAPALLSSLETDTAELAALVEEILAFSRAGNRQPVLRQVQLATLVRDVLARESADVDVETSIPADLSVVTDPTLLGRALGNLLRNAAVHAGPAAKAVIASSDTPDAILISVTDNGPGVPVDELVRIFEPFHRLDRARSRDTGGSGLGLAIVRSAVQTCGGETSASLPAEGGLRVTIRLPKHKGEPAHRDAAEDV